MKDYQNAFAEFFEQNKDNLKLEEVTAEIKNNDGEISGGRFIKNVKSNQLFTGKFEKVDVDSFLYVWNKYKENNRMPLISPLMERANAMIRNYNGEVCPIEVMLYTANIIGSSFTNRKLMEEVAEAVCKIVREREYFIKSIEHILKVWKWEPAINVCEIAVGKIAALRNVDEDIQLLKYIYNNFHYQKKLYFGCFCGLFFSKKEEVVIDILNMIHDLKGTDIDKQIGNLFRDNFAQNFPDHFNRIDAAMFTGTSPYVQSLIKKMLTPNQNTFTGRYKEAVTKDERRQYVDAALNCVIKDNKTMSPYDAINVLKLASNVSTESISEQLFLNLGISGKKSRQYSKTLAVAVICNYFGSINYPPAIQAFMNVKESYDFYAAIRLALFFQNKISSDTIIENFLSAEKSDQVKIYIDGFFAFNERTKELRMSIINYFNKNLSEEKFSTAITNYDLLIQKYRRRFYDSQFGVLIKSWFGYETILQSLPMKLQNQMACLDIISNIIDDFNYKSYEKFLYYVAEENLDFSPSVSNLAKKILSKLEITIIRFGNFKE